MPMRYELTKDLETGNLTIDMEHRQLFEAVNRLMDACATGKGRATLESTIKFLLDYVDRHFSHEEELQKRGGYPGYPTHHMFHENYERKLREITGKIPLSGPTVTDLGALNAHVGVLISHIKTEDKKLGAFLKEKGIR